ncbi:MAG: transposase [Gammaproteobacteria bacterium]
MIYIDESGVDTFLVREYARDIRGEVVYWQDSGKRFARESFIAGLKNKHFISPFCYQGTMDTNLFNFWLVNFLLPNISVGDVIVMDNGAFDKSEKTKEIIEEASCELIFLPPYSPDLNPIEKYWASLKVKIKNNITRFKTLAESIDQAFKLDQLNFN